MLYQTTTPADTLALEHLDVVRALRPAACVRDLHHAVRTLLLQAETHHTRDHIHILGKRVAGITARRKHHLGAEQTVTTRHVVHCVDLTPTHLTHQEASLVLQVLEQRDRVVRGADFDDDAVLRRGTVTHGHRTADRDNRLVLQDGKNTVLDGIASQDAVHVGVDEIRRSHYVQAAVDGVSFRTAVHLVHHRQLPVFLVR